MKTLRTACGKALAGAVLLATGVLGGCCSGPKVQPPIPRGPVPAYADVAAAYNTRVQHLDRLWARTTIRFVSVDPEGKEIDEQGEGHLQIVLPRKLYLTVGKVGETGYELGSNDTRYWWIDVRGKSAQVGEHVNFDASAAGAAGLPVHPLDLVEVLGITPLGPDATTMAWSDDGRRLLLRAPARVGDKVLALNPETYEPLEIRLIDSDGQPKVLSVLEDPLTVKLPDDSWVRTRTLSRIEISVPSTRTSITLWMDTLENRGSGIKERAFDFEALVREYGVIEVQSLDGDRPSRAGPG